MAAIRGGSPSTRPPPFPFSVIWAPPFLPPPPSQENKSRNRQLSQLLSFLSRGESTLLLLRIKKEKGLSGELDKQGEEDGGGDDEDDTWCLDQASRRNMCDVKKSYSLPISRGISGRFAN